MADPYGRKAVPTAPKGRRPRWWAWGLAALAIAALGALHVFAAWAFTQPEGSGFTAGGALVGALLGLGWMGLIVRLGQMVVEWVGERISSIPPNASWFWLGEDE